MMKFTTYVGMDVYARSVTCEGVHASKARMAVVRGMAR